jgi:ketosteroid isomerase-like protein
MAGAKGAGSSSSYGLAPGHEGDDGASSSGDDAPGRPENSGPTNGRPESGEPSRPKAASPADLARLFLDRANAGDVDGVVALYETDAVLAFPPGQITIGAKAIREVYAQFLSKRPTLVSAGQAEHLVNQNVALTSTLLPGGGATAEVARQQPDGTWLWAVDQPRII